MDVRGQPQTPAALLPGNNSGTY